MEVFFLFEEKKYTGHFLNKNLGGGTVDKLCSQSFCKIVGDGIFKFSFVGLMLSDEVLVAFLPKYYDHLQQDTKSGESELVLLNRVLQKAGRYFDDHILSGDEESFINRGMLGLYMDLLENYMESGWYTPYFQIETNDYNHTIDWTKTVQKFSPVLTGREVIYPEVSSRNILSESNDVIGLLHRSVVAEAYEIIGRFVYPDLFFEADRIPELEKYPDDYLGVLVTRRLNETFRDDDIKTLSLLSRYLNQKNSTENSSDISVFGTNAFYYIWEIACSVAFGNQKHLQGYFREPVWHLSGSDYRSRGRLIPDILLEENGSLYILDAKYYLPKYYTGKGSVENEPKTESISKQILYQLTLEKVKVHPTIYNGFLFPKPSLIAASKLIREYEFNRTDYTFISPLDRYRIYINYVSAGSVFQNFLRNARIRTIV